MDRQAVYYKAGLHLLKQGRKSEIDGNCRYRDDDGLSCAVGALIPAEMYDARMENISVVYVGPRVAEFKKKEVGVACLSRALESELGELTDADVDFLYALQVIHDRYQPHEWKDELIKFADKHNLDDAKILAFGSN